jgi:uncharacterized protein YegP (UPF0339 family)
LSIQEGLTRGPARQATGEVSSIRSKFRIKVVRRGGYSWILQEDRNYKTIACSGKCYVSPYNCRRAMDNLKGERSQVRTS